MALYLDIQLTETRENGLFLLGCLVYSGLEQTELLSKFASAIIAHKALKLQFYRTILPHELRSSASLLLKGGSKVCPFYV
jgi:hypothetical protein